MSPTVSKALSLEHRISLEDVRPDMAKAQFKKVETDLKEQLGQAIARAIAVAGWSQKEAAAWLHRDVAQVSRWIAGTERPQFDALFALEALRWPLITELARLDGQAEVITSIRRKG